MQLTFPEDLKGTLNKLLIAQKWRKYSLVLKTERGAAASALPVKMWFLDYLRRTVYQYVVRIAWLVSDLLGWPAAMTVYPAVMQGKVAIVTGANSGIGFEATKALLQQGATVIMASRTLERGQAAKAEILQDTSNYGPVGEPHKRLIPLQLDLEDFPSIKQFVSDFHSLGLPLHLLVNNAGVHLKPYARASLGFERTMAVNYFAPFWLTQLLMDDLKASAPSRVVNTASIGESWGLLTPYTLSMPYDDIPGYHLRDSGERPYVLSKTMMLMAGTREMARRLEGTGVDVFAIHPGVVNTPWYLKVDKQAYTFSWIIHNVRAIVGEYIRVGQSPKTGAISLIYASIDPSLTGTTSNPGSFGIVDGLARIAFGGRLKYYGPSYVLPNWNNAGVSVALNPWIYSKGACSRLYDATIKLARDVERQLANGGQQQQQVGGKVDAYATVPAAIVGGSRGGMLNEQVDGSAAKTVQRRGVVDAPMGPSAVAQRT